MRYRGRNDPSLRRFERTNGDPDQKNNATADTTATTTNAMPNNLIAFTIISDADTWCGACTPNAIYLELGDAFAQFCISRQATAPAIRRAQSFRSVAGHIAMPGPRYLARPRWRALRRLRPPRCFEMAWSCQEHPVGRASDPSRPQVEDMRVDHRGTDVAVTEALLDGADVVVGLEQVGREGASEGVGRGELGNARGTDGVLHGALENGFMEMMAPPLTGETVHVEPCSGETHCHTHSRPACGYFRRRAPGSSTQPAPRRR